MQIHALCHLQRNTYQLKTFSESYKVLNDIIKMINLVKTNLPKTRLFEQFCEKMNAEHKFLLVHKDVQWIAREKSLNRVRIM